jgi:uncharacterized repeat protein (TIGR01451 family)
MWNNFKALISISIFIFLLVTPSIAQVCAFPGKDGPNTAVTSVVNTYYAGSGTASASSVTLGAIRDATKPVIAVGDLIILMQMQSGSGVSFSNSASYGSGVDAAAGRYEYATVKTISGSTLTLAAALTYTYTQNVASRQTFQVIRIPQYSSASVTGTLTAAAWNGTTGGVVAIDSTGTLNFSGTIDVSGLGFRGGAGLQFTGDAATTSSNTDYYFSSTSTFNGMKGEGTAGTPLKVNDGTTTAAAGADNYTNGSVGRGAPGNAGGGSNDFAHNSDNGLNAGGGGGSNGGAGGMGGNSWHNNVVANGYVASPGISTGKVQGGLGGSAFFATSSQIVMGGGGGAGDGNNSSSANQYKMSGANGGGIVLIRAGNITGTGTINANGNSALDLPAMPAQTDAGGGGGAGGSIVVWSANGTSGLTANAKGGKGGNPGYYEHGPGGGGGGGFIAHNGGVLTSVTKGLSGLDQSPTPKTYGAVDGTDGFTSSFVTTTGTPAGAGCLPALTIAKSTSTPGPFPSGGSATYTILVSNAATAGTARGVRISDLQLPTGFTFASAGTFTPSTGVVLTGTTTVPTIAGLATKPAVGNSALNWDSLDIPASGTVSITFTVNITAGTADGTYHNPASISYADPTRSTAARILKPFTNSATSTANGGTAFTTNTNYETGSFSGSVSGSNYDGTAAGAATENVVISSIPTIALVKSCTVPATCETANQLPGTDLTYKIVFSNTGGIAAQKLLISDPIPITTDYQVAPGAAVTTSAGLTWVIEYSSTGGTTWTYVPTSGAGGAPTGYDRTITHIRWRTTAGSLSAGTPGELTFTVKIR